MHNLHRPHGAREVKRTAGSRGLARRIAAEVERFMVNERLRKGGPFGPLFRFGPTDLPAIEADLNFR